MTLMGVEEQKQSEIGQIKLISPEPEMVYSHKRAK